MVVCLVQRVLEEVKPSQLSQFLNVNSHIFRFETFWVMTFDCWCQSDPLCGKYGYLSLNLVYISLVIRKSAFCICENKDAYQLRSSCAADQRLCFRYTDSSIPLLPKSEISSL